MKIEDWIENVINGATGFKTFETREFVVFDDREIGVAEFVIRSLANPFCDGSDKVLGQILEQRKSQIAELKKRQKSITE